MLGHVLVLGAHVLQAWAWGLRGARHAEPGTGMLLLPPRSPPTPTPTPVPTPRPTPPPLLPPPFRHGENLLIDSSCGDTFHVDFGCLFDKGLTLEVPEMVPFRCVCVWGACLPGGACQGGPACQGACWGACFDTHCLASSPVASALLGVACKAAGALGRMCCDRSPLLHVLRPLLLLRRLTQNVIDCFGVSGVEGVYKKCAEVTLQVGWAEGGGHRGWQGHQVGIIMHSCTHAVALSPVLACIQWQARLALAGWTGTARTSSTAAAATGAATTRSCTKALCAIAWCRLAAGKQRPKHLVAGLPALQHRPAPCLAASLPGCSGRSLQRAPHRA